MILLQFNLNCATQWHHGLLQLTSRGTPVTPGSPQSGSTGVLRSSEYPDFGAFMCLWARSDCAAPPGQNVAPRTCVHWTVSLDEADGTRAKLLVLEKWVNVPWFLKHQHREEQWHARLTSTPPLLELFFL